MQNLLFTIIAFKEGFFPQLNFLLLLNFLPHSQLQLRSKFSCKEKKKGLLPNDIKKKKRKETQTQGHLRYVATRLWMRCPWLPTAALTLRQPLLPWLCRWCEEFIVQGRAGDLQEAVHASLRREETLRHTRHTLRHTLSLLFSRHDAQQHQKKKEMKITALQDACKDKRHKQRKIKMLMMQSKAWKSRI